jgi:hypothetical protein
MGVFQICANPIFYPLQDDYLYTYILSSWWFGTFFFPYIGNVIIPTGFHIFQRGRYTTNQIDILLTMAWYRYHGTRTAWPLGPGATRAALAPELDVEVVQSHPEELVTAGDCWAPFKKINGI